MLDSNAKAMRTKKDVATKMSKPCVERKFKGFLADLLRFENQNPRTKEPIRIKQDAT